MQDLISQVEDLAGIEIDHTTSMVMIFGIIFLTAVVVHIILHWVVLRTFEKRAIASSRLWLQIITQNKLFHRLAFTLQGIIVNIQAVFWLQKGTEAADILTTCAQLWIMMYALLSVFSLLDVILNLAQKFPTASQLPLKGIFQGIKTDRRDSGRHFDDLAADWSVASDSDQRSWCNGCRADVGI